MLVLQVPTGYRIYGVPWDPDPPDTVQGVYDTTAMRQWGGALSGGFTFDATRHLVGDVTGNGYDDVVTIRRQPSGGLSVWVHRSTGTALTAPDLEQLLVTGAWSFANSRQQLADLDGDDLMDLVSVHAQPGGGIRLWAHMSTGSSFEPPVRWDDLRTDGWSYSRSRQIAGDVDGDGRDDVVSAHRLADGRFSMWSHWSSGTAFLGTGQEWINSPYPFAGAQFAAARL